MKLTAGQFDKYAKDVMSDALGNNTNNVLKQWLHNTKPPISHSPQLSFLEVSTLKLSTSKIKE